MGMQFYLWVLFHFEARGEFAAAAGTRFGADINHSGTGMEPI